MSATDRAYAAIRRAILEDVYEAGERLVEETLVKLCGVSRTPVREALARLETEGFVESLPNQGARVASWSLSTIGEVFALRSLLESYAAERAAKRATADQVSTMSQAQAKLEAAFYDRSPDFKMVFTEMNAVFHNTIFQAAHEPRLAQILMQLSQLPVTYRTLDLYDDKRIEQSIHHHQELLQAIKARDPAWAKAAMDLHMRAASSVISRSISAGGGAGAAMAIAAK